MRTSHFGHATIALAMAAVFSIVTIADAATRNPFVAPAGWAGLLLDPAVRKDVDLSAEQIDTIDVIIGKGEDVDALEREVRKHVMGEQLARIEQLNWQREGGYALFDPTVAKALSLDEKQQKQLADAVAVNDAEHRKMRDFMARARFRSQEAMEEFVEGYHQPANERLLGVLTEDQQAKLKKLLGKPLVAEIGKAP